MNYFLQVLVSLSESGLNDNWYFKRSRVIKNTNIINLFLSYS